MAIPASREDDEIVVTSTGANLQDAIAGLLNGVVANCLPPGGMRERSNCDRTTSVTAQAASLPDALIELIGELLAAMEAHDGAIRSVELHGVMTGPDRCTIWGQACLAEPGAYRLPDVTAVEIGQWVGEVSISATLRAGS